MFSKIVAIEPVSLIPSAEEALHTFANEVVMYPDIPADDEEIVRRIGDADAVLLSYTSSIRREVMERCPNIKYIGMCCSLYSPESANVDIIYANEHGIKVTGIRDYGDEGVVEYVISELVRSFHGFGQPAWEGEVREITGLKAGKPVLMIIGGSLGSVAVNTAVRNILPDLLKDFQIIHLCGKGKLDTSLTDTEGYVQYEYIKDELSDLFALSDLVISRAGANAICEISALKKPNLLIPLSANASRGDQILNARSFERLGYSKVLEEEEITNEKLLQTIRDLYKNREQYIEAMSKSSQMDSIGKIVRMLCDCAK